MQQSQSAFVIPQNLFASAPALEVRELGRGQEITQKRALEEVEALNEPADAEFVWRLETRNELVALIDLGHKNANGAYSRDETLRADWYWTSDEHPEFEGARVVVGFRNGDVDDGNGDDRCFARAVRVARQ